MLALYSDKKIMLSLEIFTGKTCEVNIDDCQNVTCQNGAQCQDGINQFRCACLPGYVCMNSLVRVFILLLFVPFGNLFFSFLAPNLILMCIFFKIQDLELK